MPLPSQIFLKHLKAWRYKWGEDQERAFQLIKIKLNSALVLAFHNVEKAFEVETYASKLGNGIALLQEQTLVEYLSKKFNTTRQNWSAFQQEFYAIVRSLKYWEP